MVAHLVHHLNAPPVAINSGICVTVDHNHCPTLYAVGVNCDICDNIDVDDSNNSSASVLCHCILRDATYRSSASNISCNELTNGIPIPSHNPLHKLSSTWISLVGVLIICCNVLNAVVARLI